MNVLLVGKLLDRAAHPSTAENDARLAMRKISQICQAANKMPSDVINIDPEVFLAASMLPNKQLLEKIADLKLALEDAEEHARALADVHREQREADRRESEERERALQVEIAEHVAGRIIYEARITDLEQQVASLAAERAAKALEERAVAPDPSVVQIEVEAPNAVVDEQIGSQAEPCLGRRDWKVFERLAATGFSKFRIATELGRQLGRTVSTAFVNSLLRQRWSPSSGRRFALWGAT